MDNTALLFLTESVLGKGQATSKGNYAFKCPFCTHHKNKMEISLRTTEKKKISGIVGCVELKVKHYYRYLKK